MPSQNRGNDPAQIAPIYTVYPAENQANTNRGIYQSHMQAPPPKYEDVINGKVGEFLPPPQPPEVRESQQAGVVFVAPVYKYSTTQQVLGAIFTIIFIIAFVSVFIKIVRF